MKTDEDNEVFYECGLGWHKIIDEALDAIKEYGEINPPFDKVKVLQVKQKFGGLRIYLSDYNDYINGVIRMAERMCLQTCESCGRKGALNHRGSYVATLCRNCAEKDGFTPSEN